MITNVKLEIIVNLTHEEWSYNLELTLMNNGVKSLICLEDNEIMFYKNELNSLLIDNCDYYWELGKEIAETCGLCFGGFVECEDCSMDSSEYKILKKQVDELNEKHGTTIGFGI